MKTKNDSPAPEWPTDTTTSHGLYAANAPMTATRREIDLLGLANRFRWVLLAGLIVGGILGQALYVKLGPEYEATGRILVAKKVVAPLRDDETVNVGNRGEHIALIMSPLIVNDAIRRFHLDELPSLKGEDNLASEIISGMTVKRTAGQDRSVLNVLDITYRSKNRNDAETVSSAIIEAYQDYLESTRREHTAESLKLITKASDDLLADLREKESQYLEFRKTAPLQWRNPPGANGQPGDVTNVHQERLLALEAERRRNMVRKAEIESRIRVIEQAKLRGDSAESLDETVRMFISMETGGSGANMSMLRPSEEGTLDSQLIPQLLEEKKLMRDYGDDYPDLVNVRQNINTLLKFYKSKGIRVPELSAAASGAPGPQQIVVDASSLYLRAMRSQIRAIELRDVALGEQFDEESRVAKSFTRYLLEDQSRSDEIIRLRALHKTVIDQFSKVNVNKDGSGYRMQQISPVTSALVLKRQFKFLSAGAIGGLAILFGLAYLWTLSDTRLKTADEIRSELSAPLLGAIPQFRPMAPAGGSVHRFSPAMAYIHNPGSQVAEAYRSVRTALQVTAQADNLRVLQVSSPLPGDGKSTFICNLAAALAQSGKRVLLIDADLRNPSVHRLLGMECGIGLADVLNGEIDLLTAVQETSLTGMKVLSAGSPPANPAELLASPRMTEIIKNARDEFDVVLVDSPPLLVVTDPCVVAAATDGMILVLRLMKNKRAAMVRCAELLENHGVRVAGIVANGGQTPHAREYGAADRVAYGRYFRQPEEIHAAEANERAGREALVKSQHVTSGVN